MPSNTSSLRKCLEEQSRHLFNIYFFFFRNNEYRLLGFSDIESIYQLYHGCHCIAKENTN